MKYIPKYLFLVLIGLSVLAYPAGASDLNTTSVTIQTPLIPVAIYVTAIILTIGLICFAITRRDHSAIWLSVLSVLSAAFCLGCSFSYGTAETVTIWNQLSNQMEAVTTVSAVTNIGCTIFSVGLLVFSVIMLTAAIFTTWQQESKKVM